MLGRETEEVRRTTAGLARIQNRVISYQAWDRDQKEAEKRRVKRASRLRNHSTANIDACQEREERSVGRVWASERVEVEWTVFRVIPESAWNQKVQSVLKQNASETE